MALVAILALVLALVARRERLRRVAAAHEWRASQLHDPLPMMGTGPPGTVVTRSPGLPGVYRMTEAGRRHLTAAQADQRAASRFDGLIVAAVLLSALAVIPALRQRGRRAIRPEH